MYKGATEQITAHGEVDVIDAKPAQHKLPFLAQMLLTIAATLIAIPGSGQVCTQPTVTMTMTPNAPSLVIGQTQQFTVSGTFSDNSTQDLTNSVAWNSTNSAAAIVSSTGLVTPVGSGSATIQATLGSDRVSTTVTVLAGYLQWTAGDAGAAQVSRTYMSNNVTAGDLILVFSHWDNPDVTASASDNLGNTYIPISDAVTVGTARFQAWYAKNINGGPLGVTVTYSGTTTSFSLVDAMEYSGLDTTAPLDTYALGTGSGSFQDSGPTPMTKSSNDVIIGMFGFGGYGVPYTAGAGFTLRNYDASSMLEDQVVTSMGSYHATATSGVPSSWAAYAIAFKLATQPALSAALDLGMVTGGTADIGVVSLSSPAPANGVLVNLSSSNTAVASVPASILIPAGQTTASFPVNTSSVAATTLVSIFASYAGAQQTVNLTVEPPLQQMAQDVFNRANGTSLGPNWTPLIGTNIAALQLVSQQIESAAVSPSMSKEMYYGGLNWSPNQYSEAQVVSATGDGYEGPAVRMTSNDTYYACLVLATGAGNAKVQIVSENSGNQAILASSTTATVAPGDTIRCTVQDTSLTMTDQTTSTMLLSFSDSGIASGYPGVVDNAGSVAVSNYVMANWAGGADRASLVLSQIASDDFNRPDALNLGSNWHVGTGHGPVQIVSQQAQPYPDGGVQPSKEHYVASGPFPNDQWAQLQVVFEDTIGDLAVELRASDSSDTMYVCDINLTGAAGTAETRLVRVLNGVITPLVIDQQWSVISPGDYIRGQVQGNLISLINVTTGSLLLTTVDTSVTSGYPGISLQAVTGAPADHIAGNWSAGKFGN